MPRDDKELSSSDATEELSVNSTTRMKSFDENQVPPLPDGAAKS